MRDFPFNDYDTQHVLEGIESAGKLFCKHFNINKQIIEDVKEDIKNGVYKF